MIAEEFKRDTEYCTFCPKMCRFVCPTGIAEARETVTPTGKQTLLYLVQHGAAPLDAEAAGVFYQCTGCGLCTEFCDHDIEPSRVMESARAGAVTAGVVLPEVRRVLENFRQFGNAYGNLFPAYAAAAGPRMLADAQVFYVPDASALANNETGLKQAMAVLELLGAENVAMWPGPVLSSGYELLTLGLRDAFVEHAKAFVAATRSAKLVIFASPHDAETVARRYADFGVVLGFKPVTETKWLLERLRAEPPAPKYTKRVLYHDSCALGRGLGEYDEPREIINLVNGAAPLEFAWNRKDSKCCGWGGGYAFVYPESARRVAQARMEEAKEQTFDEIVTASPSCAGQLAESSGRAVPIYDLMSWLAERL